MRNLTKREKRKGELSSSFCLSLSREGSGIVKDKTLREVCRSECRGDLSLNSCLGKYSFPSDILGREDLRQSCGDHSALEGSLAGENFPYFLEGTG